jgi:hypothetical protein
MGLFRRRRGRHDLGSAVRDIPTAPPVLLVHPPAPEGPPVDAAVAAEVVPAGVPEPTAAVPLDTLPVQPTGPRVELGFRDGSTAALAPDSAQARALTEIAQVLTRRD